MSSREVAEYLVAEVLVGPASEQEMSGSLSSLSALASCANDLWHSSVEEEVVQSNLFCSYLDQQSAFALAKVLV